MGWIRRFLHFHDARQAGTPGASDVRRFLHHLATVEHLAPKSRDQAASALARTTGPRDGPPAWTIPLPRDPSDEGPPQSTPRTLPPA